ncbi:unnamed protein product, partial [Bursaphelenchus xylophilus]
MSEFSPQNVVSILLDKYGVGDAKAATREEQKVADRFVFCIEQCKNGMTLEEENEEAEVETDNYDSDPDYEDLEEDEPDSWIRSEALQIANHLGLKNFKASHNFIQNFKKQTKICSRQVTRWVASKKRKNALTAEEKKKFVNEVKAEMQKFPFDCVLNCDQTPIYKEMHSNRTLGLKGEKIVDRYCQSTASVKKNFTVMPILFADGTLSDKVYVCMQEPNDFFLGNHENTLTMIELVYHQLLNIRFKDSWNYAWYKPGYVEQRSPERFLNPREVCFPDTVGRPCQILDCEDIEMNKVLALGVMLCGLVIATVHYAEQDFMEICEDDKKMYIWDDLLTERQTVTINLENFIKPLPRPDSDNCFVDGAKQYQRKMIVSVIGMVLSGQYPADYRPTMRNVDEFADAVVSSFVFVGIQPQERQKRGALLVIGFGIATAASITTLTAAIFAYLEAVKAQKLLLEQKHCTENMFFINAELPVTFHAIYQLLHSCGPINHHIQQELQQRYPTARVAYSECKLLHKGKLREDDLGNLTMDAKIWYAPIGEKNHTLCRIYDQGTAKGNLWRYRLYPASVRHEPNHTMIECKQGLNCTICTEGYAPKCYYGSPSYAECPNRTIQLNEKGKFHEYADSAFHVALPPHCIHLEVDGQVFALPTRRTFFIHLARGHELHACGLKMTGSAIREHSIIHYKHVTEQEGVDFPPDPTPPGTLATLAGIVDSILELIKTDIGKLIAACVLIVVVVLYGYRCMTALCCKLINLRRREELPERNDINQLFGHPERKQPDKGKGGRRIFNVKDGYQGPHTGTSGEDTDVLIAMVNPKCHFCLLEAPYCVTKENEKAETISLQANKYETLTLLSKAEIVYEFAAKFYPQLSTTYGGVTFECSCLEKAMGTRPSVEEYEQNTRIRLKKIYGKIGKHKATGRPYFYVHPVKDKKHNWVSSMNDAMSLPEVLQVISATKPRIVAYVVLMQRSDPTSSYFEAKCVISTNTESDVNSNVIGLTFNADGYAPKVFELKHSKCAVVCLYDTDAAIFVLNHEVDPLMLHNQIQLEFCDPPNSSQASSSDIERRITHQITEMFSAGVLRISIAQEDVDGASAENDLVFRALLYKRLFASRDSYVVYDCSLTPGIVASAAIVNGRLRHARIAMILRCPLTKHLQFYEEVEEAEGHRVEVKLSPTFTTHVLHVDDPSGITPELQVSETERIVAYLRASPSQNLSHVFDVSRINTECYGKIACAINEAAGKKDYLLQLLEEAEARILLLISSSTLYPYLCNALYPQPVQIEEEHWIGCRSSAIPQLVLCAFRSQTTAEIRDVRVVTYESEISAKIYLSPRCSASNLHERITECKKLMMSTTQQRNTLVNVSHVTALCLKCRPQIHGVISPVCLSQEGTRINKPIPNWNKLVLENELLCPKFYYSFVYMDGWILVKASEKSIDIIAPTNCALTEQNVGILCIEQRGTISIQRGEGLRTEQKMGADIRGWGGGRTLRSVFKLPDEAPLSFRRMEYDSLPDPNATDIDILQLSEFWIRMCEVKYVSMHHQTFLAGEAFDLLFYELREWATTTNDNGIPTGDSRSQGWLSKRRLKRHASQTAEERIRTSIAEWDKEHKGATMAEAEVKEEEWESNDDESVGDDDIDVGLVEDPDLLPSEVGSEAFTKPTRQTSRKLALQKLHKHLLATDAWSEDMKQLMITREQMERTTPTGRRKLPTLSSKSRPTASAMASVPPYRRDALILHTFMEQTLRNESCDTCARRVPRHKLWLVCPLLHFSSDQWCAFHHLNLSSQDLNKEVRICKKCRTQISNRELPACAVMNGLELDEIPEEIKRLSNFERLFIQRIQPVKHHIYVRDANDVNPSSLTSGVIMFGTVPLQCRIEELMQIQQKNQTLPQALPVFLRCEESRRTVEVSVQHIICALKKLKEINQNVYGGVELDLEFSLADAPIVEDDEPEEDRDEESSEVFLADRAIDPMENTKTVMELGKSVYEPQLYQKQNIDLFCYPDLHPTGVGGYAGQDKANRLVPLSFAEYFKICLEHKDLRFATHKSWGMFAYGQTQQQQMRNCSQVTMRMRKRPKTVAEFRELLDDPKRSAPLLSHLMANLKGDLCYWTEVRARVMAHVQTFGTPTFFLTFASPIEESRTLLKLYQDVMKEEKEKITPRTLRNYIKHCPAPYVQWYGDFTRTLFNEILLQQSGPLGEVAHFFYRHEYQYSGVMHTHALLWIKDAPKKTASDEELDRFLDGKISTSASHTDSQVQFLINKYQLHDPEHNATCLKEDQTTCRFHFPKPIEATTKRERTKIGEVKRVVYRRTAADVWVNNYCVPILLAVETNMDVQYLDPAVSYSILEYVTKYVSKLDGDEVHGSETIMFFDHLKQEVHRKVAQRTMRDMINKRRVSTIEAAAHLLAVPQFFFDSSHRFINTNTPDLRPRMMRNVRNRTVRNVAELFNPTLLDNHYPNRPIELKHMTLFQFACWVETTA